MGENEIDWTDEAEEFFKKVPPFARVMARQMIEDYAKEEGKGTITKELLKLARAKFGM